VVLASTIAVAALAAGYVAYSAEQQKAAREAENFALEQRKQKEAIDDSSDALERYAQALKNTGDEQLRRRIEQLNTKRNVAFRIVTPAVEEEEAELQALYKILGERRSSFVDSMFDDTRAGKMQKILDQLAAARAYLADPNLGGTEESKLQEIVEKLSGELEKLANGEEGKKTWQEWFGKIARVDPDRIGALGKTAAELYLGGFDRALSAGNAASGALGKKFDLAAVLRGQQDQIQQAVSELLSIDPAGIDDPFSLMDESVKPLLARFAELGAEIRDIEYAETIEGLKRKIADLGKSENDLAREAMIANGYLPEQADAVKALMDEYDRKDILAQYQRQVDELGLSQEELARQTLVAKGATEEELAAFDKMVKLLNQPENFQELFTGWIQEGLNGLGLLDKKATEVIGNLAYQLASISFDAALEGFSEIGKALAQNKDAGDAMRDALASMSLAILDALPNLFLQAGLQLVATPGMWPLGLGLIAAAGAVSVLKGYTHGVIEQEEKAAREASKNAHGNVFGMEGLVPYARGGSFTNQIVQTPTSFRYGGSLGLMGEAGPEAIIPLKRMPSGNLGVEAGIGGSPTVVVNIMNNSGAAVNATEKTDGRGNRQIDVIIGKMIDDHLSSGRADRALTSRYDMKVKGV
jgi:hypothetical protein